MMKSLKKWALIVASGAALFQWGCLPWSAWTVVAILQEDIFG